MVFAYQKFKIVNDILNKSIFDQNVISIILKHYWNNLEDKRKILLKWVDISKLDWSRLSLNRNAINLLEENLDKVDWDYMSLNPNAINLLFAIVLIF